MENFLIPESIGTLCTAVAGVVLFALSPYLPAPFPPSVTRFVGMCAIGLGLTANGFFTESWQIPAVGGAICLAALVVIHLKQTSGITAEPDAVDPPVTTDETQHLGN